ncbi:sigma-54-dependent Fis family transcriptional regulator [Marinobacterium zhoushanense]|uniref:Sigma-54-dependent Fis family transcriptional regulator n=1 Tax=Marinobacterium zhoushanense TaxID=1679163 RepID=A0ABQ1JVA4_9GAMM|nr:sigma-54-dependent Fis family transcriptional regulator [Marinobacterium zhoushanense]GGB78867.1 sigma-54-dependent Fis family transcriptional regulator [Marinobacterium zhoushanense]
MRDQAEIPTQIRGSWERCIERYHLEPGRDLLPPRLTDREVKREQNELDSLLHVAEPVFQRLRHIGDNSGYCVLVTNTRGVVLRQLIDTQRGQELADNGLSIGTVWTEDLVGTNGLGTCLATREALTVYAEEHFGRELRRFSCSTAPIISPHGEMIGALDISTYAQGERQLQALAQNLVCDSADQIEAAMFRYTFRSAHLLTLVWARECDPAHSSALIATNDRGVIIGITSAALMQLGARERAQMIGLALPDMFGVALEDLLRAPLRLTDNLPLAREVWLTYSDSVTPAAMTPTVRLTVSDKPLQGRSDSPLTTLSGNDPRLARNAEICQRVINRGINILLQGETGTGKEVWARAIHQSSQRKDKPFVTLNCAAIPESLIESELFGYGAGTFTGALKGGKVGKIQASNGGTLFLDEIGDMPLVLQARLLRVLAEGEITPLGEIKPVPIDLHVITATHRDLKQLIAQGGFREDLYYRISGVRVELPALRERADRSELIEKILQELSESPVRLSPDVQQILGSYPWPGNIRQLKNVLQFALCMCDGDSVAPEDLPEEVFAAPAALLASPLVDSSEYPPERMVSLSRPQLSSAEERERSELIQALEANRWVVSRAAKRLGISRSTLHRKINKYDLG